MTRTLCLLLVAALGSAAANDGRGSPQDYTQWRGRDRDGAASAFVEPKVWPEALTRRWRVDVGEGYATPVIVGSTVYTFTRRGGDEVLSALDTASGGLRWRSTYPSPYTPSTAAAAHGASPKATPVYDMGRLITLGISGLVTAFDAHSGRRLWQTAQPNEPPYFSAASSPAAEGGIAYAHPGNYGPLTAFDARTGDAKWRAGEGGFFAAPLIVDLAGVRQAVTVTQTNVIGVELAGGRELWRYPWPGASGGPMPVLWRDMLVVSALNAGVVAHRPILRDGQWSVETVWQTKEVSMYLCNPVVVDGTLFGLSHRASGQFFALDAATGKTLWLGPPRQATNTAIVKSGTILFLLNEDGQLIVARSSRTGFEPIRRYTVADSATWAQPAISGRRLFVKDTRTLTLWTVD